MKEDQPKAKVIKENWSNHTVGVYWLAGLISAPFSYGLWLRKPMLFVGIWALISLGSAINSYNNAKSQEEEDTLKKATIGLLLGLMGSNWITGVLGLLSLGASGIDLPLDKYGR